MCTESPSAVSITWKKIAYLNSFEEFKLILRQSTFKSPPCALNTSKKPVLFLTEEIMSFFGFLLMLHVTMQTQ